MARTNKTVKLNKEEKHQPFSLQYMAYGKAVWELGLYKRLPAHIREKEPKPWPGKEARMQTFNKEVPLHVPFYKEYFIFYYNLQSKKYKKYEKKYRDTPYEKKPLIKALCNICFLKKFFPKIENHPPKPFPYIDCCYQEKTKYHFKRYQHLEKLK